MMNVLTQIVSVWLFYVLNGIILVGMVKVEVQSSARIKDHRTQQNHFESAAPQAGSWTQTIVEKVYIRRNVIRLKNSKRLISHPSDPTELVSTVSVTRGLCILFHDHTKCCQIVLIIHCLLSMLVILYFFVRVGENMKRFSVNLIPFLRVIMPQRCANQKFPKSYTAIATSLLFLILGLTLCIPLRNWYITSLTDQEDRLIKEISRHVIQNDTDIVYLSKMDLLLVFYFSILNILFLLSFSYCFATVVELMQHEVKQQLIADINQSELIIVKINHTDLTV